MQQIKTITGRSVVLIALIVLFVLLVSPQGLRLSNEYCNLRRVRPTRLSVGVSRGNVDHFREQMGAFPSSLQELNGYLKQLPDQGVVTRPPGEFISKRDGDYSDHRELDGTGGMYYNPATGEIRVNLTKPVKHYLWPYLGAHRNEVPADW